MSKSCEIDGCDRPHLARGLCRLHYERRRRYGDAAVEPVRREPRPCIVEGCDRVHIARGWCWPHYLRWRRHGDPEHAATFAHRFVTAEGRVWVYAPDHPLCPAHANHHGYMLEHRKVAWDAGLFDDPVLVVHHIDGNPSNNSLENLQPMTNAEHARLHAQQGLTA
jgi:HNH endonuclease